MTPPNQIAETALAIAAKDSPLSMLAVIDRAARDPNVDVTKMERLLDLAEKIHARESKALYDQAMNAAQGEMRPISRDCHNPQTRSRYASYEAIDNAIRPIYTTHGFAMSFGSKAAPGGADRVMVTCRISHRGGHTEYVEVEMPADGKGAKGGDVMTKTHAVGSALSYGKRYLVNLIWNLSFGESDDDGNAASPNRQRNYSETMKTPHWSTPPSNVTQATKTPEKTVSAPLRATAEDVLPKKATEATRKAMLEFLYTQEFTGDQVIAFARAKGYVAEGENDGTWNLDHVPTSKAGFKALADEIRDWLDTPEPPKDMPNVGPELPPEIANVVISVPRVKMKKVDYDQNPDTIGSLYAAAKAGDEAAKKRLWGLANEWPCEGWTNASGKHFPPSEADNKCRDGLDKFLEYEEQKHNPPLDLIP